MTEQEIRVRLRHIWVSLMAFPLTDEQAADLAAGDRSRFSAGGRLDMEFSPPFCRRCHLDYVGASYSCPGETTSFSPDGEPVTWASPE